MVANCRQVKTTPDWKLPCCLVAEERIAMVDPPTTQHGRLPMDGDRQRPSPALIIRQKEPVNLETPLDQVDSYLTPAELFYIRSHFTAPKLEESSYQLRIDGAVRNSLALSCRQLRNMPAETRVATLECAGNS